SKKKKEDEFSNAKLKKILSTKQANKNTNNNNNINDSFALTPCEEQDIGTFVICLKNELKRMLKKQPVATTNSMEVNDEIILDQFEDAIETEQSRNKKRRNEDQESNEQKMTVQTQQQKRQKIEDPQPQKKEIQMELRTIYTTHIKTFLAKLIETPLFKDFKHLFTYFHNFSGGDFIRYLKRRLFVDAKMTLSQNIFRLMRQLLKEQNFKNADFLLCSIIQNQDIY